MLAPSRLDGLDGIVIPGGFGERGLEGKIAAAGYAREHGTTLPRPVPRPSHDGRRVRALGRRSRGSQQPRARPDDAAMRSSTSWMTRSTSRRRAPPCASGPAWPSCSRDRRWQRSTGRRSSPSAIDIATRSTPDIATGSSPPGCAARAHRRTTDSSSSSSCRAIPFWIGTQAHPEFKSRPDRPSPAVPRPGRCCAQPRTRAHAAAVRPRQCPLLIARHRAHPPS